MIVKLPESTDYFSGAVSIDQPQFSQKVDRQPYAISHRLSDHPLLQLGSLMELCAAYPPTSGNMYLPNRNSAVTKI